MIEKSADAKSTFVTPPASTYVIPAKAGMSAYGPKWAFPFVAFVEVYNILGALLRKERLLMDVELVHVFTCEGRGGNPCPIVTDADSLSSNDMQAIAREQGHESGFVLSAPSEEFDYSFRFWVPNHEMEMCGHATIGALWLLASKGKLGGREIHINTLSGIVTGFVSQRATDLPEIEITQPAGKVQSLDRDAESEVLAVLGMTRDELLDLPIQNAVTSRIKTLVPVRHLDRLNALTPDFSTIDAVCIKIGSTGLYPYAAHDQSGQTFDARQFPRSSGYQEDAATGIAASALAFGLLASGMIEPNSKPVRIMQGRAMGSLSQIEVQLSFDGDRALGCLLGGAVTPASEAAA
jgi:PhzF family phenazine biosynthesis protein